MGDGGLVAVTDAGPIIHLTDVGCLGLLSIFEHLHVPDAVWLETVGQGRASREPLWDWATFGVIPCFNPR